MKLMSITALFRRTNRELESLKEEIRRDIGACEDQRQRDYAALDDIRKVHRPRRIVRWNL